MHAANDPATACVAVLQLQNLRRLHYVQPSHARQETESIMYATRRAALEPRWWSAIPLVFWTDGLRRRRRPARRVPEPNKYYHLGAVKDATPAFVFFMPRLSDHAYMHMLVARIGAARKTLSWIHGRGRDWIRPTRILLL